MLKKIVKNPLEFNSDELYFWDSEYYLEHNPDIESSGLEPYTHFINHGWKEGRNPSKYFNTKKYLDENPEIVDIDMHPFTHMQFLVGDAQKNEVLFPVESQSIQQEFKTFEKGAKYKRIVIFASFISDGIIPSHLLFYLKELKNNSDGIIFVGDNPIFEKEIKKIKGLVNYVSFHRHEEYDFGSYKEGLEYAQEKIGLENIDELVLCNDSCVGPLMPFDDMFKKMQEINSDFWGLTIGHEVITHLQSFFLVFKNKVILNKTFTDFFSNVKKEYSRSHVIIKYELLLTKRLADAGFSYNSYLPYPSKKEYNLKHPNVTISPNYLIEKQSPLIKLHTLTRPHQTQGDIDETLKLVYRKNPKLHAVLVPYIAAYKKQSDSKQSDCVKKVTHEELIYNRINSEIELYIQKNKKKTIPVSKESAIVHKYLDGLNGIEIGASNHDSFGLDKTGAYANVDYKTNHTGREQEGRQNIESAKVNIVAYGDDLPFKDESFDYVVSSHAIECFFDPIKAIDEWFRVVRKDGYVVMIVSHKDRTFDKLRPLTSFEELTSRHSGVYTAKNYMCKLEKTQEDGCLPHDFMRVSLDGSILEGYECAENQTVPPRYNVWNTHSFLAFCIGRKWKVIDCYDSDDKIGDGFMVILQKVDSSKSLTKA